MRGRLTAGTFALVCATPTFAPAQSAVVARLEQRAEGIYLVAPSANVDALVAKVTSVDACIVEEAPKITGKKAARELQLICPGGSAPIAIDATGVSFGARRIGLPGPTTIAIGLVPRASAPVCAAGTKGPVVNVAPRAFYVGDLLEVELQLPELGVVLPLASGGTRIHSTRLVAAHALRVGVGSGMSGWTSTDIRPQGQLLLLRSEFHVIGRDIPEHTIAAYWLPCGATVQTQKVNHTTKSWFAIGSVCSSCSDADDVCQDRCYETLTDPTGNPTDAGYACLGQCSSKLHACEEKCAKH